MLKFDKPWQERHREILRERRAEGTHNMVRLQRHTVCTVPILFDLPNQKNKEIPLTLFEFHEKRTPLTIRLYLSIRRKEKRPSLTLGEIFNLLSHWFSIYITDGGKPHVVALSYHAPKGESITEENTTIKLWQWNASSFASLLGPGGPTHPAVKISDRDNAPHRFGHDGLSLAKLFVNMYGWEWQRRHINNDATDILIPTLLSKLEDSEAETVQTQKKTRLSKNARKKLQREARVGRDHNPRIPLRQPRTKIN